MNKYYVNGGSFQGETVAVEENLEGKTSEETVMAILIDDHGKNITDESFPIPVGFLEPM